MTRSWEQRLGQGSCVFEYLCVAIVLEEIGDLLWSGIEQRFEGFDAGGALLNGTEATSLEDEFLAGRWVNLHGYFRDLDADIIVRPFSDQADRVDLTRYGQDAVASVPCTVSETHNLVADFPIEVAHGCTFRNWEPDEAGEEVTLAGLSVVAEGSNDNEWGWGS